MSWFGDTFGDSINSLKGQITKITKDVLANEETDETEETSPSMVKELEALCESKDLEIASLREEFNKLQDLYKTEFLKNQSKINNSISEPQTLQLQNELLELRKEKDHLNSCLDELQSEHQENLNQVILIRDKYKSELEALEKEHKSVKKKLEEALNNQEVRAKLNDFEKLVENKDNEISLLNEKIRSLQLQVEAESNKEIIGNKNEDNSYLKEQVEQLSKEIEVEKNNKQQTEEDNKKLQSENNNLRSKLSLMEKDAKETEIKLKMLYNEKEELSKKCEDFSSTEAKLLDAVNYHKEIQNKMKNLLQSFNIGIEEEINDNSIIKFLSMIDNVWRTHQSDCQQSSEKLKQIIHNLESEVNKLKEENVRFQNDLKGSTEKWKETEKNYLEEINGLKNTVLEIKTQREDSLNESQTDDVKRLEQEVVQFRNLLHARNNEIKDFTKVISNLKQELQNSKTALDNAEQNLSTTVRDNTKLKEEIKELKKGYSELSESKIALEEKIKIVETKNLDLEKLNSELKTYKNNIDKQLSEVSVDSDRVKSLELELKKMETSKIETENMCSQLQKANNDLKNNLENLKAQLIVKETNLTELMKSNTVFQEEINKLQSENNEIQKYKEEIKKWKEASVDLEIQRQDLIVRKDELESECLKLRSDLELSAVKDAEISQLKLANSNLIESCNKLHQDLENRIQAESMQATSGSDLEESYKKQLEYITELQEENTELKTRIQKFQEQMKLQIVQPQNLSPAKDEIQQHRRSRSAVDIESSPTTARVVGENSAGVKSEANEDVSLLKQAIQQEQQKYRILQNQFQEISDREANARKEFERLKQHLIEIEDHYTEEAVENEKVINELKSKLVAAEEQLQNSSTLYTSMKVRDNQHVESLQSQIRMISSQRDDFQSKLSAAEDEVQKHKASLMSLQIVLEQFQQDKEREVEGVAMKYEKQLQQTHEHFRDFELEIDGLKKQLAEAKNGLKAASRLGEQLEKKSQQVAELEENLGLLKNKVTDLENSLATANQSSNAKIDKSLIKNLVVGYILSPNGDRKSQVLKIMASVLDFDNEERNKMGVDNTSSGWLSNILHPKGGGPPSNQSLSEAFIKFLENESRPQPQVKFVPEQFEAKSSSAPKPTSASPKPSGRFSELMLPTFNSSQENESSVILKSVLKDS